MTGSIRPCVNVNVKSNESGLLNKRKNGIVLMPLSYNFGANDTVVEIVNENDIITKLGGLNDETIPVKEAIKNARKVLVYKVNTGNVAKFSTNGDFSIKTKQTGTMANLISIKVDEVIGRDKMKIITFFNNEQKCVDIVDKGSDLYENDYITYNGKMKRTSGIFLTGASTITATNESYVKFFNLAATLDFDVLVLPIDNFDIKLLAINFTKRMRETENKKIVTIVSDYEGADYEGIISVKNGVILNNGQTVNKINAVGFIAGLTASSDCNKSNTYEVYDGAIDVDENLTDSEIENQLSNGHIVFSKLGDKVIVEKDINTLITFLPTKNQSFSKNRVIRVIDEVTTYIRELFLFNYIGKITNDDDGRLLFKGDVITYLRHLKEMSAIGDFDATKDIEVLKGDGVESIICNINIKPLDSMEKLQININI